MFKFSKLEWLSVIFSGTAIGSLVGLFLTQYGAGISTGYQLAMNEDNEKEEETK